jgi:hypothetical protein
MGKFLNLGDYESVCHHRNILLLAFGLDPRDPNYMPVTRDLSRQKVRSILHWLKTNGPDGKPLLGTPPSQNATAAPAAKPTGPDFDVILRGGKTAAARRRLSVTRKVQHG